MNTMCMKETRTSAFSVEIDDAPLYRRFNNVALGESAVDGPDSLRFYENIRHEYLMDETNKELKNEGVAYLGIWTADKAEAGLSFRIDAVNITSGLGYIKPQYLISVSRQDQEAVEGTPCTEMLKRRYKGASSISTENAEVRVSFKF